MLEPIIMREFNNLGVRPIRAKKMEFKGGMRGGALATIHRLLKSILYTYNTLFTICLVKVFTQRFCTFSLVSTTDYFHY